MSVGLPFYDAGGTIQVVQGILALNAPVLFNGVSVAGPGAITFNDGLQNNQAFSVNGTMVSLNGGWTNSGAINATNAVLNLDGTFTVSSLGILNLLYRQATGAIRNSLNSWPPVWCRWPERETFADNGRCKGKESCRCVRRESGFFIHGHSANGDFG
jgi:hypothetical protein